MGYLTQIMFIGKIKNEYQEILRKEYESWKDLADKLDFVKEFSKLPRADFIPTGYANEYGEWDINYANFNRCRYDVDGEIVWEFWKEFKDYDNEMETFIETVAPNICDEFLATTRGEEQAFPTIYIYKDGKLYSNEEN